MLHWGGRGCLALKFGVDHVIDGVKPYAIVLGYRTIGKGRVNHL